MNKKAFTLVELLAVIIILGILAVLIGPKIVKTLDASEKNTYMTSAEGIVKAATYKYSNNEAEGKINKDIIIDYGTKTNINYLEYTGDKPESGQIIITEEGNIALAVKLGDYCYSKKYDSSKIQAEQYNELKCTIGDMLEKKQYKTGEAIGNYGGYNWHVISDDGDNVTLLMDAKQLEEMPHCTDDTDSNTDCTASSNGKYYKYSWDKSLIQKYLNETFYKEIKYKIGNRIIPANVCIDPSISDAYSYGGYLKSEIDNINEYFGENSATCNNYSNYNVRLISITEYYNMSPSPHIEEIILPYEGKINNYQYAGKVPKIDFITKVSDKSWLYSHGIGGWWTMGAVSGIIESYETCAWNVESSGDILEAGWVSGNIHNVRPVITVAK